MKYSDFYKDLTTEDYPQSWSKDTFDKISSFSGKLKYANQHLVKLASGSGRAVFKIDDQKVLKVAKNKKGLAQNNVEAEPYIQNYDMTTHVFDFDQRDALDIGPFWIEAELAKKLTPTRFNQLVGFPMKDLEHYLRMNDSHRPSWGKPYIENDPIQKKLQDNEFVNDLFRMMGDYDMPTGDLGRLSSYGEVIRDGKPKVVLVDYGLNRQVWDDFYKVELR